MAKKRWTITAPLDKGSNFSGIYFGIQFNDGEARVEKQYFRDLLLRNECSETSCEVIDSKWTPKRILVIRLGAYGDNIMITSALRGLRNKYPDATIHFIGSQPHNSILANNPHLNGIIILPAQDIGHIVHDYDEVYDLFQHIEHNPESDWENAYDLAEQRLDVVDYVEDHRPVFVPTASEIQEAKNILIGHGFNPDDNKLILIHAESSSMLRRMSIETALAVSQHFINKGYKILFAGHDHATPNLEFQRCLSCNKTVVAEITGGKTGVTIQTVCPHCKEDTKITKTDNNKNIFFLHKLLGDVSARVTFTIQKFVDLVIAVDSAHSHIAAALDIPSVLLYGPFHPDLRARYYDKARILFRPTDCGSCNQLSPHCVIYPKGPPPCMTQYSAEEIIKEAEKALDGSGHKGQELTCTKYQESLVGDCPNCKVRNFKPIARKGYMFYVQCQACSTIYIEKKQLDLDTIYTPDYVASDNPPSYYHSFAETLMQVAKAHNIKGNKYLDFGCGDGDLLYYMLQQGWEVCGIEREQQAFSISLQSRAPLNVYNTLDKVDSAQDLISLVHVIEHIENPIESIRSIIDFLNKNGILFIYGHDANTYQGNNSWLPINTKRTGEHLQIFPREEVDKMLKELGLNILTSRRVGKLDYMITAQKV